MKFQPVASGRRFSPLPQWRRVPLLVALVAVLAGCNRPAAPAPAIDLTHEITPEPVQAGPASLILNLKDAAGRPVSGAHIEFEGDMSHPGMAPVFGEARETTPGRYQGPIEFVMGGDWVILVHIALPHGQRLEKQIQVMGVKAK